MPQPNVRPYTIETANGKRIAAAMRDMHGQDYLEIKWRIVWFREDHPDWGIITECREHVPGQFAVFYTRIVDSDGKLVATGSKMETKAGFLDYYEKAETGSTGRALLNAGYGTANCGSELDEGDHIADSPVDRPAATPKPPAAKEPPTEKQHPERDGSAMYRRMANKGFPEGVVKAHMQREWQAQHVDDLTDDAWAILWDKSLRGTKDGLALFFGVDPVPAKSAKEA